MRMPDRAQPGERRLNVRLAILITFLVAAGSVLAVFFAGTWAVSKADGISVDRQIRGATRALDDALHKVPTEQESATIWDAAVVRSQARDRKWLEDNLGVWMFTYFGHDIVYVLDEHGNVIYAMEGGATAPALGHAIRFQAIQPMIARLRADILERSRLGPVSAPVIGKLGATDFAEIDGGPAIVSVKPIVTDDDGGRHVAGTEYLHVSIKRMGKAFADDLADRQRLDNARLVTGDIAPGHSAVPIMAGTGKVLGFLEWDPYTPGKQVVRELAPVLAIVAVPLVVLLFSLLASIWRSSVRLEESEKQARFLALHDTLTGLPNRTLFNDQLERALEAQERTRKPVAVFVIDIDAFKHVNDTLGHPAGDELVRAVGERLEEALGAAGVFARLGGDEFALLIDAVGSEDKIDALTNAASDAMREPFILHGEKIYASVSIGIFIAREPGLGRSEVVRKADIALHQAKEKGGHRAERFVEDMDEVVRQRRKIEVDLREALATGEGLRTVFQPIFSADGGVVVGAEALIRWDHPVHGNLSPMVFIGVAEERGTIGALTDLVIEDACIALKETGLPWISVNASPVRLHEVAFPEALLARLREHGLGTRRLQLEITENVLIEDSQIVSRALARLRDAGIAIALDDFGTGYSSLKYLREYPVDKIKIDQSFVRQLGTAPDSDAIVRAIVALARALKKRVVAEGIETIEQQHHLAALGCHELQGFYLSHPLSMAELKHVVDGTPTRRRALHRAVPA
jgi:diguanylate cyclase (GGDEF)-like protein